MPYQKKIYYVTQAQYDTLYGDGTTHGTVGSYTWDANAVYYIKEPEPAYTLAQYGTNQVGVAKNGSLTTGITIPYSSIAGSVTNSLTLAPTSDWPSSSASNASFNGSAAVTQYYYRPDQSLNTNSFVTFNSTNVPIGGLYQGSKHVPQLYNVTGSNGTSGRWLYLGYLTSNGDTTVSVLTLYTGDGYNGNGYQNSVIQIFIKDAYQGTPSATSACGVNVLRHNASAVDVVVAATSPTGYKIYVLMPWSWGNGTLEVSGDYNTFTYYGTWSSSEPTGTLQNVVLEDNVLGRGRFSRCIVSGTATIYRSGAGISTTRYISSGDPSAYAGTAYIGSNVGQEATMNISLPLISSYDGSGSSQKVIVSGFGYGCDSYVCGIAGVSVVLNSLIMTVWVRRIYSLASDATFCVLAVA